MRVPLDSNGNDYQAVGGARFRYGVPAVRREVGLMLRWTTRKSADIFHLPGRDWLHCMGPGIADVKNLTVGLSIFPPGSAPPGHVHRAEEEVIYVVNGRGELRTSEGTVPLEPGVCVYVPVGLLHSTACYGPEPLELVTAFSPPVVPGSYELDTERQEVGE